MPLKATKDTHARGVVCILCCFKERQRAGKFAETICDDNEKEQVPESRKSNPTFQAILRVCDVLAWMSALGEAFDLHLGISTSAPPLDPIQIWEQKLFADR